MAETKSGYKLIHLKFQLKGILQFAYVLQKWLERIDECENITLGAHALPTASTYYAYINNGELTAYIRPSDSYPCKFGTSVSGGSSYMHTGLSMQLAPWSNGMSYFDYIEAKARIIVDKDNNLVFGSTIEFPDTYIDKNGFLFTNNGIMSISNNTIYSMGTSPAQMAICGLTANNWASGINGPKNDEDLQIFRSKGLLLFTASDEVGIRDHIEVMFSNQQQQGNYYTHDLFEQITVDGQKYLHLGYYTWIPFDEETTEIIEVTSE